MKTTFSIIKADIGSIGGHIRPSEKSVGEVRNYVASKGKGIISDFFVSHTGAAMLPYRELEYGGIVDKMKALDKKFKVRS